MIYIVIPVHNRKATTLKCLACLAKQTYQDFQIIIVDDGSTDGTATAISAQYPNIIILSGDGKLWWAGAMAKGVDYVLSHANDSDFVLSLNNDVMFDADYLNYLVNTSQRQRNNTGAAVVGSLCRDQFNHNTICDSGITMRWYKYLYGQLPYDSTQTMVTNIDTISGRGTLIPVSVLKRIGNFDCHYLPHYGADYEFGFRAKAADVPLVMDYRAVVYLDNELTGFRPTAKVLSYREEWQRLFSIKSPANMLIHLKIIWRHCPNFFTKIFDVSYVIAGNMYIFIKNTVRYSLQLLWGLQKS